MLPVQAPSSAVALANTAHTHTYSSAARTLILLLIEHIRWFRDVHLALSMGVSLERIALEISGSRS